MELGNAVFGNSRGEYPVERGFEQTQIQYLLEEAGLSSYGNTVTGDDFDNGTFVVRPYYWGDCNCGGEDRLTKWCDENPHSGECYQTALEKRGGYAHAAQLAAEWKLPYDGCAVHCTCGRDERYFEAVTHLGCSEQCRTVLPNFHFKPTDYRLKWYKYPLRDAYANENLSRKEFKNMVDACLASLKPKEKHDR